MSLKILGRLFTGPFALERCVVRHNHDPAVWAVVSKEGEPWNASFRLIAVGETGDRGVSFAQHPDRAHWESEARGTLGVYLHALPRSEAGPAEREALAQQIGAALDPPRGLIPIG